MSKILIIEDDEMIRNMYQIKLTQEGYEVAIAKDGIEAVKIAKEENADLILLDIIMPGMDGFSVLEELRINQGITAPIIMLTNLGTDEDKEKGKDLGADGYLVKSSLTPSQISAEIKNYIK